MVGKYWEIDEVRPAFALANGAAFRDAAMATVPYDRDEKGRIKFPMLLLTAHKPG